MSLLGKNAVLGETNEGPDIAYSGCGDVINLAPNRSLCVLMKCAYLMIASRMKNYNAWQPCYKKGCHVVDFT